jgi:hypothetical protein
MHPEMFSRWLFNGVLIESGIRFDDVTLSEGGHPQIAGLTSAPATMFSAL